jgi:Zn-finger nucleic acid-binding protein
VTAYREQATQRTVLFCPRDNELLDQVDFGVDMCPRCEGFWIGNSVLELSGNQWPAGPQAWWRNAVRCPACATTGVVTVMKARTSNEVIIDQCFAHGVWLDRGELARVMRDPVVQELAKLREHLAALEPSEAQLLEKRERWQAEQEERARLADVERKRIESERKQRAAEAAKTEQQRAEDRRRANEEKLREVERLAEARRAAERDAEAKRADWQRIQAEIRIQEDRAAIAHAEQARKRELDAAEEARRIAAEREHQAELELQRERARELTHALGVERARTVALERERARAVEAAGERVRNERADPELRDVLAAERKARERVEYLVMRTASLRLELSTYEAKLAQARTELEEAEVAAAIARGR